MEHTAIHIMVKLVSQITALNAIVVQDICVQHRMVLILLVCHTAFPTIISLVTLIVVNYAIQPIFCNVIFRDKLMYALLRMVFLATYLVLVGGTLKIDQIHIKMH